MSQDTQSEEAIFVQALELDSSEKRSAYLDQACGADGPLRRRIAALLRRHDESQGMLEAPPPGIGETLDFDGAAEHVGSQIGPYRLVDQLGEGGMGIVYVARQERPMLRNVALKIIKPGMDTREVIARFEAERQALAMMDHPHIAKVLDAGTTESGRPYFAMELVRGIPLTDYSDRQRLATRQRLELFVATCQAVQHAHQKGVIHRDLKPSNVLVTEMDGRPLPKVIDFGVAKAINQRLTERTIYTRHQQMIGTPLYMSPEQADLSALDVDTRSDIYSLGVLLYELLTGVPPFDQERFHSAGYDELRRIIREEEPPKPSTRISTLGDAASTITDLRRSDPKELRHQLRGELDWIVMKALEKDRNRRYETASAAAADVQRYLRDEPVEACPPSRVYRFAKFARRNKRSLVTASVIGLTLVVAMALTVWQWYAAVTVLEDLQAELRERVLVAIMAGDEQQAQKTIDRAEQAKVPQELITLFRGQLALYYGKADEAIARLREISDRSIAAQAMLAHAYFRILDYENGDVVLAELANRVNNARHELTVEDKLFAGHAMVNSDVILGLELVEQAIRESGRSPLAEMIHAQSLAGYAHNTGDVQKVDQAIEEIRAGMRWVGRVPEMFNAKVMVQGVAFILGRGEHAGVDTGVLRSDWEVVKALPMGRVNLIRLLALLNDPAVPQLIQGQSPITDVEMCIYVPVLLQYKSPADVLAFVEDRRQELGLYGECARARLMALLPERRGDAEQLCDLIIRNHRDFYARSLCLNTLLLLGEHSKVRGLAPRLLTSSTASAMYAEEITRFLATSANEEDFLHAGGIGVCQLEAWFTLAMLQHAQGQDNSVRQSLENCAATKAWHSEQYWWARVIAESVDDDSTGSLLELNLEMN